VKTPTRTLPGVQQVQVVPVLQRLPVCVCTGTPVFPCKYFGRFFEPGTILLIFSILKTTITQSHRHNSSRMQ